MGKNSRRPPIRSLGTGQEFSFFWLKSQSIKVQLKAQDLEFEQFSDYLKVLVGL